MKNWSTLKKLIWLHKANGGGGTPQVWKTASGAIASFVTQIAYPMKKLVAQINPVQAGTGDPSPDNIRPISGHTGLSVEVTGFNVWDEEWEVGKLNATTGQPEDGQNIRSKNFIPIIEGKSYYWSCTAGNAVMVYDADKNFIRPLYFSANSVMAASNFAGGSYIKFYAGVAYGTTYNHDISINYPSTDTSYHAYTGTTTTVSWQSEAGTVYGGTATYNGDGTWTLVAEYALASAKKNQFNAKSTGSVMDYRNAGPFPPTASITDWDKARQQQISNMARIANANSEGQYGNYVAVVYTLASGLERSDIRVSEDLYQTMTADDPIEVCYKLLEPQTYTITTEQLLTSLYGQNNVWVDTGDVEVEYLESGLPEAYTQVAGFTFNSDCYFEIGGLKLRGSDTVMFSMIPRLACNVFGCYTTSDADNNYSLYVSTANNAKYLRYNGSTYKSKFASADLGERYDISITPIGSHGFPEGQDDTWTEATFEASTDMCIGTTATNASSAKFKGDLLGVFTVAGRFSGVPCKRNSDNVLGYYDMVSKQFYEPADGTPTVVT